MPPLLRVEQNPESEDSYQLLGYAWLEVLWVEPWALAVPAKNYGAWADRQIVVQYVCMTPDGVVQITGEDFWAAIEEYQEYVAAKPEEASPAPLQVIASSGSVVHIGASMGSSFGAIGDSPGAVLQQISGGDLKALAAEIRSLREGTPAGATDRAGQIRAGALAEAEEAAERGDAKGATSALRRVADWAAENANKLGLALLARSVRAPRVGGRYVDRDLT